MELQDVLELYQLSQRESEEVRRSFALRQYKPTEILFRKGETADAFRYSASDTWWKGSDKGVDGDCEGSVGCFLHRGDESILSISKDERSSDRKRNQPRPWASSKTWRSRMRDRSCCGAEARATGRNPGQGITHNTVALQTLVYV